VSGDEHAGAPTTDGAAGTGSGRRNRVVAVTIAVLVVAGLVADGQSPGPRRPEFDVAAFAMPEANGATALSSVWFCPAGIVKPAGGEHGEVIIANPTEREVTAIVTVRRADGQQRSTEVDVPALGQARQDIATVLGGQAESVRVDADGGGVVVEHRLVGIGGSTSGACSPRASSTWYFASGVTQRGAREFVMLYNPFPAPAIVDFAFVTDEGAAEPPALVGFVVEGRSARLVDIGGNVRRQVHVATSIVARTGQVVAERVQAFDGTRHQEGIAVTLGAPSAGLEWTFPDGQVGPGTTELLSLYNPGEEEASVDVEVHLEEGEAEPFQLTVPPGGFQTIDVGADGRVAPGVAHALVVRSLNSVPVVAERRIIAGDGAVRRGVSYVNGARRAARRWVAVDGRANEAVDEWLVVFNPTGEPVTLSVGALVGGQLLPVSDLQSIAVEPLSRRAIRVGDHIERDALTLLVDAASPVVVERSLYAASGVGMSAAIAIPLP
jgi:hypothetical protein